MGFEPTTNSGCFSVDIEVNNWGFCSACLGADLIDPKYLLPPPNPQRTTNEILRDVLNVLAVQNKELAAQKETNNQLVRIIEENAVESKKDTLEVTRQGRFNNRVAVLALIVGIIALIASTILGYLSYKASLNNQSPQVVAPASPESPQGEVK